jgi:dTMP kinase
VLIVIAGTDGSGKSTVAARLLASLSEGGLTCRRRDKWDIYDRLLHPSCKFLRGPLDELRSCISSMPVPARTLFLFWTMHMTMRPELLEGADITVVDSYIYKHAASELLYGAPADMVEALSRPMIQPDAVFLLDIDPREAWRRKLSRNLDDVVPYECGMSTQMDAESFCAHQSRLREQLQVWAREKGWHVLDATRSPEDLVETITSRVQCTLGTL